MIACIARAPRSTLFARGARAAQRLLPGHCRRGRGGCTRPPTHSAHAARACSSTHRRKEIHRAISTRWNDGCRRTALHSLPPPSPDTDGRPCERCNPVEGRDSSAACAGGAVRDRASARERRATSRYRHARSRTPPRRKLGLELLSMSSRVAAVGDVELGREFPVRDSSRAIDRFLPSRYM